MVVDLERIAGKRVAVHLPTKESAQMFYDAIKAKFPYKISSGWGRGALFLDDYEQDTGMCYYPRFTESRTMSYGKRKTYDDWGVPVVEFSDLLMEDLDTCLSDMEVGFLFT